ncbi:hypothetical protein [Lactobacillus sp. PV012]|nr:hypothetical protein [Lactobacillus sp. PV012]
MKKIFDELNFVNKETKKDILLALAKDRGLIEDNTPGFTNNKKLMNYMKTHATAIKETIELESNGVGDVVRKREKDKSGFTNIEEIDWGKL